MLPPTKWILEKLVVLMFILFLAQCKQASKYNPFEKKDTRGKVIAKVYDVELFESDLASLNSKEKSRDDSVAMAREFVNNWVKQQLLLKKANLNLADDQKNVQAQLDEYRNSLIIYLYEKELVRQRLDTLVNEDEIQKFYDENKNNFEQKSNIVQLNYVKYEKKKPAIDKIRIEMQKANIDKNYDFIDYCQKNAANYFFKSTVWLEFNDLLKEVPIKTYDQEQFIQNNKYIEVFDDNYIYFVKILDFKIKNSISELPFVSKTIRTTILNTRKVKLMDELERKMMEDALNSNDIKIN
ncbi:MAG: hypothetical protein NTW54_13525 [Bacteroidetes bacterium]|nr:hypothetical protein [Bacteroidota bacterium]